MEVNGKREKGRPDQLASARYEFGAEYVTAGLALMRARARALDTSIRLQETKEGGDKGDGKPGR